MKINKIIKSKTEVLRAINRLREDELPLVIWQKKGPSRVIVQNAIISELSDKDSKVVIDCQSLTSFTTDKEILCHNRKNNYIFKSNVISIDNEILELNIPQSITIYSEAVHIAGVTDQIDEDATLVSSSKQYADSEDISTLVSSTTQKTTDSKTTVKGSTQSVNNITTLVEGAKSDSINEQITTVKGNSADGYISTKKSYQSKTEHISDDEKDSKAKILNSKANIKYVMKISDAEQSKEQREENYYKDKRESERKKFASSQFVKLVKQSEIDDVEPIDYKILDLSSGGIGFESTEKGEFRPGMVLVFVEIAGSSVQKVGEIRSVRRREDNTFKVGVIFRK